VEQPERPIHRYHDGTKHHFDRFARSLGHLDWATQPRPFRSFAGAFSFPLYPKAAAGDGYSPAAVDYDRLYEPPASPVPVSAGALGDLLRHALGLSSWKVFGTARWSLRVNPSSGNLHPTEAYVVCGPLSGLAQTAGVYHYAADAHALEQRCAFDADAWRGAAGGTDAVLIALTSIHWREAWKYGERAFRYCQHDLGHAVAAIALAGRLLGWRVRLLPTWSHAAVGALTGIDRDDDFVDAERETPGCVLLAGPDGAGGSLASGPNSLLPRLAEGRWSGRASQLSADHVQWTFIDEIAAATEDPGRPWPAKAPAARPSPRAVPAAPLDARAVILRRRSAVAFDRHSAITADALLGMLARVMPGTGPLDALWWTPRIHGVLFVHRVSGLAPGLYLAGRSVDGLERLGREIRRDHAWETVCEWPPVVCLGRGDCRALARRLSCDQDIASDGCVSLGMLAEFDASLAEYGGSFYRNLYWEAGAIGQVLYLEAEAEGVRATGIGCFYDDPVHDVLGLAGHAFQSLYHFTIGAPVEDRRLTSEPGYPWEGVAGA
jgi:SagB-type dehydrogenase family enzyme